MSETIMISCKYCDAYSVLVRTGKEDPTEDEMATRIKNFAEIHECVKTHTWTKEQLLDELRKQRRHD